ncbi:TRAP transporter small permease [Mesorhizobium sp. NBSH29]|uniref:TRAP transporter small permease n=1 Tax=Mesorhizobium sp. NBSH29 TaxID=2654249 RepID=UPI001896A2CB|nr:TRAP transporter small permease [Mesorhizobium sp. NBSH29]
MRNTLDTIYRLSGGAAAVSLFCIFALVCMQVGARLLDGVMRFLGMTPLGLIVPSIAEISGFLLASASFLALAYTLSIGSHIRVGLFVERLASGPRRIVEGLVGLLATGIAIYACVAMGGLAFKSWTYNDVSFGFVPVPLWLPQAVMTLGLAILAIAIVDLTVRNWRTGNFTKYETEA